MKTLRFYLVILSFFCYDFFGTRPSYLCSKSWGQFATLFGDTYSELGFKLVSALGLYVNKSHKDKLAFQLETYFSQEGAKNGNNDFGSFCDVIYNKRLKYNYVQIPLVAKYQYKPTLILWRAFKQAFNFQQLNLEIYRMEPQAQRTI